MQVKPEIFNMMAPCMRDPKVGVTLAPQTFHNLLHPDWTDSANADFNLTKMPFSFGAGNSFITGPPPATPVPLKLVFIDELNIEPHVQASQSCPMW